MKTIFLYISACFLSMACLWGSQIATNASTNTAVVVYAPVEVNKSVNKKVFVHFMPWFESNQTNQPTGAWGHHWTMANQNPDIVNVDGRRQIASNYYPLIGPYASSDTNVIDYQLLLMKLSGIDGVFIDWPGTTILYDYPKNAANAEKIISRLKNVGLNYAMVYEDQNINIAYHRGVINDKLAAAQNDMLYLQANHFAKTNYEKIAGKPLLLVFGPQTFTSETDWVNIFSVTSTKPSFFTLWSQSAGAGNTAAGEFAWINRDNLTSLNNFYGKNYAGMKIASAYPGFHTFYAKGGWSGPTWVIDANRTSNFQTTLKLAMQSNADHVQLLTWNDYGEGTMLEPTVEFQYDLLTCLQQELGVGFGQPDLALVSRLYNSRIKYANNLRVQAQLNQVYYYLVSLQIKKAMDLLSHIN
ncbi:MAG TPA: glycoside hydrolase family 71/99-like protein [Puia sp.]|nr:glycoside hydrolase family 71/99-like protein [Puia sp.]